MNIVAVEKETNKFIESHSIDFSKDTLMVNAKGAGFANVVIKEMSNEELNNLIQAENESLLTYAEKRKAEYDQLNQFEMQYDDQQNGTTTWVDAINDIKARFPK